MECACQAGSLGRRHGRMHAVSSEPCVLRRARAPSAPVWHRSWMERASDYSDGIVAGASATRWASVYQSIRRPHGADV